MMSTDILFIAEIHFLSLDTASGKVLCPEASFYGLTVSLLLWNALACDHHHKEGPISEIVKAISLEAFQDQIWKPTQDSMQWSRTSMRSREKKMGRQLWTTGLWQCVHGKLTDCSHLFQFSERVISNAVIILCGPLWLHCTQLSEDNSLVPVKRRWSFPIFLCIFCGQVLKPKSSQRCYKCQRPSVLGLCGGVLVRGRGYRGGCSEKLLEASPAPTQTHLWPRLSPSAMVVAPMQ